jgi:hypothetical protein
MAIVQITPQSIITTGLIPAYTAVSDAGDDFYMKNNEKTYLEVVNGGAVSLTVTITGVGYCDQGYLHDETITLAAGVTRKIGIFERNRFNQNSGTYIGSVKVNFSVSADVTYGAFTY